MKRSELKAIIKEELLRELFSSQNEKDLQNYDYKNGEEVELKHKSWKEPRIMKVIKPGLDPTLKAGSIEIVLKRGYLKDWDWIHPEKIKQTQAKIAQQRKDLEKSMKVTTSYYKSFVKTLASDPDKMGYESGDLHDLAKDALDVHIDIRNYLFRKFGFRHISKAVEHLVNDMEQYV